MMMTKTKTRLPPPRLLLHLPQFLLPRSSPSVSSSSSSSSSSFIYLIMFLPLPPLHPQFLPPHHPQFLPSHASSSSGAKGGKAPQPTKLPKPLKGKTVCFSGAGSHEGSLKTMVLRLGGEVRTGISRKLNYLVIGKKPGPSKMSKAEGCGVTIVDVDKFKSNVYLIFNTIKVECLSVFLPQNYSCSWTCFTLLLKRKKKDGKFDTLWTDGKSAHES